MLTAETVAWLGENGFNQESVNSRGKHNDTPVILASRLGLKDVVVDLLNAEADLSLTNMDGTDALWAACVSNSFEIADLLIQKGIDIDNQNENGATALMYTASNGMAEWVAYLIEKGADIQRRSLDDFSAIDLASTLPILKQLRDAEKRLC